MHEIKIVVNCISNNNVDLNVSTQKMIEKLNIDNKKLIFINKLSRSLVIIFSFALLIMLKKLEKRLKLIL